MNPKFFIYEYKIYTSGWKDIIKWGVGAIKKS